MPRVHRSHHLFSIEPLESRIAPASSATFNLAHLTGDNGFAVEEGGLFGGSVSDAGDVNADGFGDIIVGAHGYGQAYVIFGKKEGFEAGTGTYPFDGTNGFRLDGVVYDDDTGLVVSGVGDVNGDGFDDVAVAAEFADPEGVLNAGSCYVIFGKATPFPAVLALSSLDGANGFRLDGARPGALAGRVSGGGDLNGDGLADLLIATAREPRAPSTLGEELVSVVFGRRDFPAVVKLSGFDGTDGFVLENDLAPGFLRFLNAAGDVNGDGFGDFIAGDPETSPSGKTRAGASYVVFGKHDAFSPVLKLSELDGMNGFIIEGAADDDFLGGSVAGGDFNGDGFADLLIGSQGADPGGKSFAGSSYVVFGKAAGFTARLNVSELDGTNGFRLDGVAAGDRFGGAVNVAGDIDGDQIDDLIIGADAAHPPDATSAGSAFLVFGRKNGFDSVVDVSTLDGTNGLRFDGSKGEIAGRSVSGAGDVNGDGFDDLVIGSYAQFNNFGSAYIVFGGAIIDIEPPPPPPPPIIPVISADGHSATFPDVDGDTVQVTVSNGSLSTGDFTITRSGNLGGGHFAMLNLGDDGAEFAHATVRVTALRGAEGGNGRVNLGYLNATGIDLEKVIIHGDLGRIDVGDGDFADPALVALKVQSMGRYGTVTQEGITASLASHIVGSVGSIVEGSVSDTFQMVGGFKVKGSVIDNSIAISGGVSRVKVGRNLDHSTVTVRGQSLPDIPSGAQTIGMMKVRGNVDGSQVLVGYDDAGTPINADVKVGRVKIGGDWIASDLAVGTQPGADALFGTSDDGVIAGGSSIVARIAALAIRGDVLGTFDGSDHYGITAEEIALFRIGSTLVPLASGPNNDLAGSNLGITFDVTIREVASAL